MSSNFTLDEKMDLNITKFNGLIYSMY